MLEKILMNKLCCIALLFFYSSAYSQNNVRIIVHDLAQQKAVKIFITGSFNNWNPGDGKYALQKLDSNKWEILLIDIPKGTLNYKFTQGQWDKEEVAATGENIGNHILEIDKAYSIQVNIYGWKNQTFLPKKHTASNNVYQITDSFYIPQLARYRKIAVYLPSNYNISKDRYSVLYMQDGQNLFDEYLAPFGEWGIDEALDTLQKQTGKYAIVVAIDHGNENRIREYNFEDNKKYGTAEGKQYVDFLANTLKPYIDKKYRTKKGKSHTAVAGSSLGGLISTYAVLKYPEKFGAAGIFSPAYWIAPSIDQLTKSLSKKTAARYWFYAGEKENSDMIPDMERIKNNIEKNVKNDFSFNVDSTGAHNEQTWRKWFPSFYIWWMQSKKR